MNKPQISFASVLWPLDEKLGLLKVRTERRFHKNIARVTEAIADDDAFLPPKAWLVPEDDHPDSPDHVAVWVLTIRGMYEVGYLPGRVATMYRKQLGLVGLAGATIEVTGRTCGGPGFSDPTVHVYLPDDFDLLVEAGHHEKPENNPAWLRDGNPVRKRPAGCDYTADELRKIYCWAARKERWSYLPDRIEWHVSRWDRDPVVNVSLAIKLFEARRE